MPKHFENVPGWFDFEDIYEEAAQRATDESVLVEIGCWRGRSIAWLAERLKGLGKSPKLYAVDTWAGSAECGQQQHVASRGGPDGLYREFLLNMGACGVDDLVIPRRGPSVEISRSFEDWSVDFAFIDASHEYSDVLDDICAWWPKIKAGGTLAGHDLLFQGVGQAVREAFANQRIQIRHARGGQSWLVQKGERRTVETPRN